MTVNTNKITSGPYTGNGVADTFSYTFKVEDKTELSVFETDDTGVQVELTVDTDYTVNTIGVDGGGTITRVAGPLPTGYEWYIRSNFEETQLTAFTSQGAFFPDLHELAMDKLTLLIQQTLDKVGRTFRLSDSYSGPLPLTLENPVAGYALRWNDDENGLENYDPSTVSNEEIANDKVVISYSSLSVAVNDSSLKINQTCRIKDRGDSIWDVVLASTVTSNGYDIVQCVGVPALNLVLRVQNAEVNIKHMGAANGANDALVIDRAIDIINASVAPLKIVCPKDTYDVSTGVTKTILHDNITVDCNNATFNAENGNIFVFGDATFTSRPRKCTIRNMIINYASYDINALPIAFYNTIFGTLENIVVEGAPRVAVIEGKDGNSRSSNIKISNIKGNTENEALSAILLKNVSVISLHDVVLLNNIPLPPDDTTTFSTAVSGNVMLEISEGADTIYGSNVVGNRYHITLKGGPSVGHSQLNVTFDNLIADYSAARGVEIVNDGSLAQWTFNNPYLRGSDGSSFYCETTVNGTTNRVNINQPYVIMSGVNGIYFTSVLESRCDDIAINDPRCVATSRLKTGGNDILIERCSVDVLGGYVGKLSTGIVNVIGGPVQGDRGINISNDTEVYSVKGLRAGGAIASYALPAHTTGSKDRIVKDNRVLVGSSVLNRPEYAGNIPDAIPASGVTYTNKYGYTLNVYTRSQAGSPFAATINVDGLVVHNRSDFQGLLEPGQTITLTYGSALGWVLTGRP